VILLFFRINDPYRLLGLFVLLLVMGIPFFIHDGDITIQELKSLVLGGALAQGKMMYIQLIDSTAPLATGIFGLADWLFGSSLIARQVIALLLIFFQASFFGILLIHNKAYNDNTYVPALVFGVLCFISFDLLSFSPELLASTVLLLALNNLFKEIEFRSQRDEIMFNLGVYLGIVTMLIFSYVIFLFATVMLLFIFSRPNARKLLLLFFGFALPHLLLITLYYFLGETSSLWQGFYMPNFAIRGESYIDWRSIFILGALPLAYFVFSIFMLNREARFTKYQSQLFQIMFLWMLFCLVQLLVTRELSPHSFIICMPSFAYFISHYLLLIRKKWVAEVMFLIFFIGIVGLSLLARYGKLSAVKYDHLAIKESTYLNQVKNQRVMILADDPGIYQENKFAGFFLDWKLSSKILKEPGYYENVMLVEAAFQSDPPDIIIDPDNLMKGFFDRIPTLKSRYKRDGVFYIRSVPEAKLSN
jgi:hypothetical protein